MVFPNRWLDHRIPSADPLLYRQFEKEANELHAHQQHRFVGELRQLLRKPLAIHQGKATDIADQLGMHERTLNRRLREEGTNFRREIEDIRYEEARHLIATTMMPLSQIAAALDYADPTAFRGGQESLRQSGVGFTSTIRSVEKSRVISFNSDVA